MQRTDRKDILQELKETKINELIYKGQGFGLSQRSPCAHAPATFPATSNVSFVIES